MDNLYHLVTGNNYIVAVISPCAPQVGLDDNLVVLLKCKPLQIDYAEG